MTISKVVRKLRTINDFLASMRIFNDLDIKNARKILINDLFQQWMDDKCIKIDFDIRDVKGFSFPLVISTSDL